MTRRPPTESDQSLYAPDAKIQLFRIDLSEWGLGVESWTPSSAAAVSFGGVVFRPVALEASGFDRSLTGTLPTPRLKISNVNRLATALLQSADDLRGARVTRIVTYAKHLDGGADPDPERYHTPEIWYVDRVVSEDETEVELELAAEIDQRGVKLPRRQVLRGTCGKIYRRWNGVGFDYAGVECPYAEAACYDAAGAATDPSGDVCGQRLSDCKLRFGSNRLPFGGFPGVGRTSSTS